MAIDPAFEYLLPYVGTVKAAKPKKIRSRTRKLKVRKPRKARIRKPRKIRVLKPKKVRVRKPRRVRVHKMRVTARRRSKKSIAAQTGYRTGMAPGIVVVY